MLADLPMQHLAQGCWSSEVIFGQVLRIDEPSNSARLFDLADHPHRSEAGHASAGATRGLTDACEQRIYLDLKLALAESADIDRALSLALRRGDAPCVDVICHDMNVRLSDIYCQANQLHYCYSDLANGP